jgi:SAM-dependent methyltransferase
MSGISLGELCFSMKNKFFEGEDFKSGKFKALMPIYYPAKYKKYVQEEADLLCHSLKNVGTVLDAGVGIGRLIPLLAPIVQGFIGIDNSDLMLKDAKKVSQQFKNVQIVKGDLEKLSSLFSDGYFDASLCLWNTLGNVKDEVAVLKELKKVTSGSLFVTVYLKGTLSDRKEWYKAVKIKVKKIDTKKEIFYTDSGLVSKSYNLKEMKSLGLKAGLLVNNWKILGGVVLWVEFLSSD